MFGVTTAIILDQRFKRKDGTFPIKLRIIYQRIIKYYPLGINLSIDDWEKVYDKKPRKEYKDYKLLFDEIEIKANKTIQILSPFSFESFRKTFNKKNDLKKDVFTLFESYADELTNNKQLGTAENYTAALNSFRTFNSTKNRKKLNFDDITPEWLQKYEDWMILGDKSRSLTTVGIYNRCLRRIINIAIEDGLLNRDFYPYGKRKYQIPAGRNIKKALSREDIQKIYKYIPVNELQQRARDMWLFSYLCNGANLKDVANLQYRNINNNSLVFIREKTRRTTKSHVQPVLVSLVPEALKLIGKWGIKPRNPDQYIFGIIQETDPEEKQRDKIKQATKVINKYMKKIGEELELPIKLTLGVTRHSWATIMKNLGASDEFVGEGLGHQNLSTTRNYLGSFENKIKASYQNQLLNFND